MSKENSGPAFPQSQVDFGRGPEEPNEYGMGGIDFRSYAAIKLRQPDSGINWLDEMILKAKRDEFARQALAGLATSQDQDGTWMNGGSDCLAGQSYRIADAMLAERSKEP